IIIFDLLYATDGHAKNFSISLNQNGFKLTPFYDVMGGYFLHQREKKPLQHLRLAMSVGNSNYYNFAKISKRHYEESAKKCLISNDDFERLMSEVKHDFDKLDYSKKDLDQNLDIKVLNCLIEGMNKRAAKILI